MAQILIFSNVCTTVPVSCGVLSHQPHTFLEYAGMLQIQGFPVNVEKSAVTGIFIFISQ